MRGTYQANLEIPQPQSLLVKWQMPHELLNLPPAAISPVIQSSVPSMKRMHQQQHGVFYMQADLLSMRSSDFSHLLLPVLGWGVGGGALGMKLGRWAPALPFCFWNRRGVSASCFSGCEVHLAWSTGSWKDGEVWISTRWEQSWSEKDGTMFVFQDLTLPQWGFLLWSVAQWVVSLWSDNVVIWGQSLSFVSDHVLSVRLQMCVHVFVGVGLGFGKPLISFGNICSFLLLCQT